MGVFRFRKARDTESSATRRTSVSVVEHAAPTMTEGALASERTTNESLLPYAEGEIQRQVGEEGHDDSDFFVCRRSGPPEAEAAANAGVTLFVYGWYSVQPGPLSWVFPSVRAALDAVRTMRNAVQWCICAGDAWSDVDAARAEGAVLIEQLG